MELKIQFDNFAELRKALLNMVDGLPTIATPDQPVTPSTPAPTYAQPPTTSIPQPPATMQAPGSGQPPAAPVAPSTVAPSTVAPSTVAPPTAVTPPAAPAAQPRIYTYEEVKIASKPLIDAGQKETLLQLRQERCGGTPLSEMTPEQLAVFAAAIRELGAQI